MSNVTNLWVAKGIQYVNIYTRKHRCIYSRLSQGKQEVFECILPICFHTLYLKQRMTFQSDFCTTEPTRIIQQFVEQLLLVCWLLLHSAVETLKADGLGSHQNSRRSFPMCNATLLFQKYQYSIFYFIGAAPSFKGVLLLPWLRYLGC